MMSSLFFFNDTSTTEIYTLSLHDALPIYLDTGWRVPPHFGRASPLEHAARGRCRHVHVDHPNQLGLLDAAVPNPAHRDRYRVTPRDRQLEGHAAELHRQNGAAIAVHDADRGWCRRIHRPA